MDQEDRVILTRWIATKFRGVRDILGGTGMMTARANPA
jgi:hypothetical protein